MKKITITIVLVVCCLTATAHEGHKPSANETSKSHFAAGYITELQSNLARKYNWANFLSLQATFNPWKNGSFEIETISTFKTRKTSIADDLQGFSNIEEDNMALTLFLAGYKHNFSDLFSLFAGVRNVNEDYFTQEYTSIFTNSSCGIYPTLSENYPLMPNQPLSAMCLHAEFQLTDNLLLKNSLYNGTASRLLDRARIFNISPCRNGVFNITELGYLTEEKSYGYYGLGVAMNWDGRAARTARTESDREKFNYTIWANIEKSVAKWGTETELGFLAQGSVAPRADLDCRGYFGGGAVLKNFTGSRHGDYLAIFANHAIFDGISETAMELTFKYDLNDWLAIQPSFHHILTGTERYNIALLRLCFAFGN